MGTQGLWRIQYETLNTHEENQLLNLLPVFPTFLAHQLSWLVAHKGTGGIQKMAKRMQKKQPLVPTFEQVGSPPRAVTLTLKDRVQQCCPWCQQGSAVLRRKGSVKTLQTAFWARRCLKHTPMGIQWFKHTPTSKLTPSTFGITCTAPRP